MTIAELLTLVGLAWPRLLIYPGGLAACAALLLADVAARRDLALGGRVRGSLLVERRDLATLSAVALPWLALALLPLPLAVPLSRPIDLVAALALLEWPRLVVMARDISGDDDDYRSGVRRAAAALNGYPPLVLATLLLLHATGTLELVGLAQGPGDTATPVEVGIFWAAAVAWLVALPPTLELGPFAAGMPRCGALRLGLRLRALGLLLIAALPWMAPLARDDAPGWVRLLLPLPPLALAGLLWFFHRRTRAGAPRRWARIALAYAALLLALLLSAGVLALQARLA